MPQTILDRILETKRKEVADLRARRNEIVAQLPDASPVRDFHGAIASKPGGLINCIAEIKKASPSAGVIRTDFDPPGLAEAYDRGGASALSVLTDRPYFQGDLAFLEQARSACRLPVLRKDFLIDPVQIHEARVAGADAVLLIAAALETGELVDMAGLADSLEMTVLLEVHNEAEWQKAEPVLDAGLRRILLGVNNRDLATFEVSLQTTFDLAGAITERAVLVSESGIANSEDVKQLAEAGVRGILVGETFMRQDDVAQAVRDLLGPGGKDGQ
jgi:indole-3-glycerol phosphate synthase